MIAALAFALIVASARSWIFSGFRCTRKVMAIKASDNSPASSLLAIAAVTFSVCGALHGRFEAEWHYPIYVNQAKAK